jgi:hypothetical protein
MGKIERLHAAEKNAPRDPAREALAFAIADATRLHNDLNLAQEAASRAKRNQWAAEAKLHALLAEAEPRGIGQRFIEATAGGESIGATALAGRPRQDIVKELEHEIDVWAQTRAECDKTAEDAKHSLRYAQARVERAVDEVLRDGCGGVITEEIVEGIEALQNALVERRVLLRFFERRNLIDDAALAQRVRSVLNFWHFPMSAAQGEHGNFDLHPRNQEWARAREALKSDASAPLPGGAT